MEQASYSIITSIQTVHQIWGPILWMGGTTHLARPHHYGMGSTLPKHMPAPPCQATSHALGVVWRQPTLIDTLTDAGYLKISMFLLRLLCLHV